MMIVDVYWLVMPTVPLEAAHDAQSLMQLMDEVQDGTVSVGWNLNLANFTALLGMFGVLIAGTFESLALHAGSDRGSEAFRGTGIREYVTLRRVELMNDGTRRFGQSVGHARG